MRFGLSCLWLDITALQPGSPSLAITIMGCSNQGYQWVFGSISTTMSSHFPGHGLCSCSACS